jgi:hypothetical protein
MAFGTPLRYEESVMSGCHDYVGKREKEEVHHDNSTSGLRN